jgi:hypothetical protein
MSNNPFLKQKNTNNRFNNLITEKPVVSSKNTFLSKKQEELIPNVIKNSNTTVSNSSVSNKKKTVFVLEEEFPLLCETHASHMTNENTFKFTDAVNTVIEEIVAEEVVRPKWVSYARQNGTTIVHQGTHVLEKLKRYNEQQLLENSPNTLMKNVVDKLEKKWEKFRVDYDLIHGEGTYNQTYILPPVYGQEYELDDEEYYEDNSSNEHFDTNEYFEEYIE